MSMEGRAGVLPALPALPPSLVVVCCECGVHANCLAMAHFLHIKGPLVGVTTED